MAKALISPISDPEKERERQIEYLEEKYGSFFPIRSITPQDLDYQNECAALEEIVYWGHEDGKVRSTSELGIVLGATGWFHLLNKIKKGSLLEEIKRNNVSSETIKDTDKIIDKLIDEKKYPNIERDQLFALSLYTSPAFYRIVNKALRREGPTKDIFNDLSKWSASIHCFIRGYRSIPSAGRVVVYRGLSRNKDTDDWSTVGKVVLFESFTSCSVKESVAKKFAANKEHPVLLQITSLSGRSLTPLSHYKTEEEIILRPYTSFRVVASYDKEIKLESDLKAKSWRMIELVEAYPDLRGRRVIMWVDDQHDSNNKYVLDKAEASGVTFVRLESTEEAIDFIEHNKCILQRPSTRFRIITDMARKESFGGGPKKLNVHAGLSLIETLRNKYGYKEKIYVYTSSTWCEETKKLVNSRVSNVYVTANTSECLKFGSFADVIEEDKMGESPKKSVQLTFSLKSDETEKSTLSPKKSDESAKMMESPKGKEKDSEKAE